MAGFATKDKMDSGTKGVLKTKFLLPENSKKLNYIVSIRESINDFGNLFSHYFIREIIIYLAPELYK